MYSGIIHCASVEAGWAVYINAAVSASGLVPEVSRVNSQEGKVHLKWERSKANWNLQGQTEITETYEDKLEEMKTN